MAHLVAGDVQRHQRPVAAVAISIADAEAAVAPQGVDPGLAVQALVHFRGGALAVAGDAAAAVDVEEVVPGVGVAGGRVDGDCGAIGRGAVAPGVVGVGEEYSGAAELPLQVVDRVTAALGITQSKAAARLRIGVEADGAEKQAAAGADSSGMHHVVEAVEHVAGQSMHDDVALGRHAFGRLADRQHIPGQRGPEPVSEDDQFTADGGASGYMGGGGTDRLGVGRRERWGRLQRRGRGQRAGQATQRAAGMVVHDDVATDHAQAAVATREAHVFAAIGIDDHVACFEGVVIGAGFGEHRAGCRVQVGEGVRNGCGVISRRRGLCARHRKRYQKQWRRRVPRSEGCASCSGSPWGTCRRGCPIRRQARRFIMSTRPRRRKASAVDWTSLVKIVEDLQRLKVR